ncbi:sine oculis-binding protein homolog isoform X1 [Daphnia pulex]|uniref:sine oculis-binding protein homolog isoform X1 n=1 Tax=Daphnia pulex TaxID=6669 RepID=UPI001EE0C07A|nr:sine oculis-binding protein homolog isoform X1 [Daphnia pulex]XP_046445879.1 sine oculis-binding protein homolog isoform X1 [Daphnia pulex]
MAQSHTSWGIRGRRELLSWDGSNSSSSTNQPSSSPTERPITPSAIEVVHPDGNCSWCGSSEIGDGGVRGHVETQGSGPAKVFCSDICFSQCRRAAFKRAKVCDWCKHVRHTVSYVDLHDGQRQLQFCTDKCRNQYKMRLFVAEASSLGVQSCATPGSKGETSPGTSIDLKKQSTGILITPDLWLSDCQLDNPINVKLECNEETELASFDSEPEEQNCEIPLNLVHSSRRSDQPVKRKPNLVEIPLSKKGKSHRKHHSSSHQHKTSIYTRNLIPPPPPTLPCPATTWPSFPYPPHMVPSYILQSQFLALNRSLKPPKNPCVRSTDREDQISFTPVIESNKMPSEPVIEQSSTKVTKPPDERTAEAINESTENKQEINHTKLLTPEIPPDFVVLRIPYLIPLPIPVPIPIPLNIHEKYLKHVLT